MAMRSVDVIPPKGVTKYIPEVFKDKTYVRLQPGMKKMIVFMVRDEYPAKDKDYEVIKSRIDGSTVMRVVYYVGFDDGTYTSLKYDAVVNQLDDWMGVDSGNHTFDLGAMAQCQEVKVVERMQKFGAREFPVVVFEPINN